MNRNIAKHQPGCFLWFLDQFACVRQPVSIRSKESKTGQAHVVMPCGAESWTSAGSLHKFKEEPLCIFASIVSAINNSWGGVYNYHIEGRTVLPAFEVPHRRDHQPKNATCPWVIMSPGLLQKVGQDQNLLGDRTCRCLIFCRPSRSSCLVNRLPWFLYHWWKALWDEMQWCIPLRWQRRVASQWNGWCGKLMPQWWVLRTHCVSNRLCVGGLWWGCLQWHLHLAMRWLKNWHSMCRQLRHRLGNLRRITKGQECC